MHKLNHMHFSSWTLGGIQSTFSRRSALSPSMLSSTTTWVTLGHSELSVCPPFCWICLWKIWHLAFPIPAGRMCTVMPSKVFPGTEEERVTKSKYVALSSLLTHAQTRTYARTHAAATCDIKFFCFFLYWGFILSLWHSGSFDFRKGFHYAVTLLHLSWSGEPAACGTAEELRYVQLVKKKKIQTKLEQKLCTIHFALKCGHSNNVWVCLYWIS